VIRLTRKKTLPKELIHTVNRLYSYKRKSLQNILKQFGKKIESKKRLEELSSEEIIDIAKQILK
jgi:16S rRNA (adenine1518-N6/adenine1519-N6)-dimethyltransferase